jgi:REP-associated tyrosine transposase
MSRPLRIEYPDAWYHVMNSGRREESVFRQKEDYLAFIELLKDTVDMWNLRVGAYCLMPNITIS